MSVSGSDRADWRILVRGLVHRTQRELLAVLDGLEPDLLDRAAKAGTNSIGWLLWHLTRSHDRNISELRGSQQVWLSDGWHARFGRGADPSDTGYRHSRAEAAAFQSPAPELVVAYHRAVVDMIDHYLDAASLDELSRRVASPTLGDTATVQDRLVGLLADGLQHVGQAALLRGMLERQLPS
ncbi:DinB family protein [Micromonospora sp. WMMD754]|uniref:DinB family protein n=1 Tax=Micromonospora sp. WMMD754 TaxID=3404114 RepID=UPI003BF57CA1